MSGWEARPDRSPVKHFATKQAEKLLASGYRKPRTITTDEDLSAAPKGIVLRELDGLIWEKQGDGEGGAFWVETGDEQEYEYTEISLPATVLWEPQP